MVAGNTTPYKYFKIVVPIWVVTLENDEGLRNDVIHVTFSLLPS